MNFNEWEHLITSTNTIIDVEFYYMFIENDFGVKVKIREDVDGWEGELGIYSSLEEGMAAVEEYKNKVEKLVALEQELF